MVETYKIKRLAGDKIALLGLFIVSLLIARLIIASKSALVLSEPIQLAHAGLSLSMPNGNGWESERQWEYHENAFTISSVFASSSSRSLAHCSYLLAADKPPPAEWFDEKADEIGGAIVETGRIKADGLNVDWAHVGDSQVRTGISLGTARLPNGRQLDIEVHQIAGEGGLAVQAFERIVQSVKFKDNRLLEAGSRIVGQIKTKGIGRFLGSRNQQDYFIIKDLRKRSAHPLGFMIDVLIGSETNGKPDVQAASFFYMQDIRGRHVQEQVTFFQSDNSFDNFVWKGHARGVKEASSTEVIGDEAGVMTVTKSNVLPKERIYQLGSAAIPDIFIRQLFSQMLDSGSKKILVDIIGPDGKITPTFVSRLQDGTDTAAGPEDAYVLGLELLNGRGFSERVYLDDQKQISKRLVRQNNITYLLESATMEEIRKQFPEQEKTILRNKILQQNQ